MQHETFRTDLGGVGVIAVQFTVDDPNHHRLIDLESPGGENAFSLLVSSPQLEAVIHSSPSSLPDQHARRGDQAAGTTRSMRRRGLLDHGLLILCITPDRPWPFQDLEGERYGERPKREEVEDEFRYQAGS